MIRSMNSSKIRRFIFPIFALCVFLLDSTTNAAFSRSSPKSDELIGQWQVTGVHIDRLATRTPQYDEGDERLLGRLFLFSASMITNNTPDDSRPCLSPSTSVQTLLASRLFSKSFGRRLSGPTFVSPSDLGIPLQANANVDVVTVRCGGQVWNSAIGADGGIRGSWLVFQSRNSAVMHWYDDTLLVLTRVPTEAVRTPSFDCKMASTNAEQTICHSVGLALLDRSVASVYRRLMAASSKDGSTLSGTELVKFQREWIKKRNACASNEYCLTHEMTTRLQELHQMQ